MASIPPRNFKERFQRLTGNPEPFPWQERLFYRFMTNAIERSLDIPTGLGKTAVMAIWLLARAEGAAIPRRLVYVVDRRAVVDQATKEATTLHDNVGRLPELEAALRLNGRPLPISTLRGQHVDNKHWLEDPSKSAIIVGTIDMIGSRLLFEGYGVSRKMRPYHAGLLGADALFVLDEAHLVPPFEMLLDAIASDAARVAPSDEAKEIVPAFKLMCLSATGRTRSDQPFTLNEKDDDHPIVRQRLDAKKRLRLKLLKVEEGLNSGKLDERLAQKLAKVAWVIAGRGKWPGRVIVFCDKRKVAKAAKEAIERLAKEAGQADIKNRTELFVGGRRVYERTRAAERLHELGFIAGSKPRTANPVFLFATSAGEVGVDLDADHMVSDLVEWERMIQRLGRVNRRGEGDAHVVVLVEPEPTPDKPVRAAMEKDADKQDAKDRKAIEAYQHKLEFARAKCKPYARLRRNDDGSIDASPAAIEVLKGQAKHKDELRAILDAATTPELLRPALTRPIVDAWSMTSLNKHTGRPEIGPWLRGWIEDDLPQTTVVWRTHLPTRNKGEATRKEIEAFFEASPPHTSESLDTKTYDAKDSYNVIDWLATRGKAIVKESKTVDTAFALRADEPLGYILSPARDIVANPFDKGRLWLSLGDLQFKDEDKNKLRKVLAGGTLIVNARFAGLRLRDGLLDSTEREIPRTADDGQDWLPRIDGEPVIRFRIRTISAEAGEQLPPDPEWRTRLRFVTTLSEEGEASGWLVVEKWRSDSSTEEDRAVGRYQLLEDHQTLAEKRARELAERLGLSGQYADILAIAARLHDEGKKAPRWQRAFNAPTDGVYAKTQGPINLALLDGYRHELRSLEVAEKDSEFLKLPKELRDLLLHLIAAHHGYGRPMIGISGYEGVPPSKLEARAREVALRFARLQQCWGPWGLAWWESLLRAVDHQASRENDEADADCAQEVVQ